MCTGLWSAAGGPTGLRTGPTAEKGVARVRFCAYRGCIAEFAGPAALSSGPPVR